MPNELSRARRGAALLDRLFGRGWRRQIRRRDLNMGSPTYRGPGDCGCILAQLYGDYDTGLRDLPIRNDARYGFDLNGYDEDEDYDDLTQAWRKVLRES